MYEIRYGGLGEAASGKRSFGDRERERLHAALAKLDDVLDAEQPSKEYLPFVTASQRQTDNIGPRRTRQNTILEEFQKTV